MSDDDRRQEYQENSETTEITIGSSAPINLPRSEYDWDHSSESESEDEQSKSARETLTRSIGGESVFPKEGKSVAEILKDLGTSSSKNDSLSDDTSAPLEDKKDTTDESALMGEKKQEEVMKEAVKKDSKPQSPRTSDEEESEEDGLFQMEI